MSSESHTHGAQIRLVNLVKRFNGIVAVNNTNITVEAGEFLTLLGPSGCGKTTTLRMIGGFEYPSAGSILIDGVDVGSWPPFRRPVNTVFQQYALFPHMTVARNVGYGLEMAGVGKAERQRRVAAALEMVRMANVEGRRPNELSGGQQQRVALARALINRPKALLLDEPLGALDLKLRKAMQFELKQLNRETGATFIYVTHDQEEALTMSDRIAVMNEGRVLQIGTPTEVYEQPADRFVADFIGQSNLIPGTLVERDGAFCSVRIGSGAALTARFGGEPAVGDDVVISIRPERVQVLDSDGESAVNRVQVHVRELVYLGNRRQAITDLSADAQIIIDLPAGCDVTPGDVLTVTLPAQHATCFPAKSLP